jgi:hypothetical protein
VWRTCLRNDAPTLVSIDSFAIATLARRVLLVFIELPHHPFLPTNHAGRKPGSP